MRGEKQVSENAIVWREWEFDVANGRGRLVKFYRDPHSVGEISGSEKRVKIDLTVFILLFCAPTK